LRRFANVARCPQPPGNGSAMLKGRDGPNRRRRKRGRRRAKFRFENTGVGSVVEGRMENQRVDVFVIVFSGNNSRFW
jgi:hypothetical protein